MSSQHAQGQAPTGSRIVSIPSQGLIEGVCVDLATPSSSPPSSGSVTAFLGIPFAQPPTGQRRWKRPQMPPPSWPKTSVRKSQWQKDPYQPMDLFRLASRLRCDDESHAVNGQQDEHLMDEDCLYLNIWRPDNHVEQAKGKMLPVLVWIYGGGFTTGSTSLPTYDCARLAHTSGCIVVSVAYRVGLFGFLGSRHLANVEGDGMGTGNYGFWDIVAGLQWCQANITAFGGDAQNVTAFGESAGAIALHYLMLSPSVPKGLFARVGLFSGTAMSTLPRTLPSCQATFDELAAQFGASHDSASDQQKYETLMRTPAKDLQDAFMCLPGTRPRTEYVVSEEKGRPANRMQYDQSKLTFEPSSMCGPTWDGVMVDKAFVECVLRNAPSNGALKNGSQGIFFGHTADEGTIFNAGLATQTGLARCMQQLFTPSLREEVQKLYGIQDVRNDAAARAISAALLGDIIFSVPVTVLTHTLAAQSNVPAFRYTWAHRPSKQLVRSIASMRMSYNTLSAAGAFHASELSFLFGTDATEAHVFSRAEYPNVDEFHRTRLQIQENDAPLGFTPEERTLSITLERHLGEFAHGESPWKSIHGSVVRESEVQNVKMMMYDEMPSLGSLSNPEAIKLHVASLNEEQFTLRKIPIQQASLHETYAWRASIDPDAAGNVASFQDKYAFWTADRLHRLLELYYGDASIHFVP